jgi:hypothetical protein
VEGSPMKGRLSRAASSSRRQWTTINENLC